MSLVPISELLRHHAARKPGDALALAVGPLGARRTATWIGLERRANQRAALLRASGVRHDDLVAIALRNSVDFFEVSFAIWKAGATPCVVSPSLPPGELRAILETARPRAIVAEPGVALNDWTVLPVDASLQGFGDTPGDERPPTYFKAMTSGGSTGRPKIIVDHKPAAWNPEQTMLMQPADGVILNPGPLYHNAPFLFSHMALFAGTQVTSLSRFDAEEALRLIAADRAEWVHFVPTMMNRIMALPEEVRTSFDCSSLRSVWHMAAAIAPSVKRAWIDWLGPDRIFEVYSATEALGGTMITGREWLEKPGSVGRVLEGYGGGKLKIVTEDGRVAEPNEVGEIFLLPPGGPGSSYHYIGAERSADPDGWESVGDIGWLDEDGYLFLADRRADLIIRGGANIFPAEIEGALEAHPAVASAVVIGLPDPDLGARAHAIIELRAAARAEAAELRDFLAESLSRYKLPESYEFTAEPLRDEAGKVRRGALRNHRIAELAAGRWRPDRLRARA